MSRTAEAIWPEPFPQPAPSKIRIGRLKFTIDSASGNDFHGVCVLTGDTGLLWMRLRSLASFEIQQTRDAWIQRMRERYGIKIQWVPASDKRMRNVLTQSGWPKKFLDWDLAEARKLTRDAAPAPAVGHGNGKRG